MSNKINLIEGNIAESLIKLAIPIMGTSFIQMAYNMTDMIWIGRIGSKAVAAVGTAGFFTWFAMAFILISKTGAEIRISQSIGRKDEETAKNYVISSIQINLVLAIFYTVALIIMRKQFIAFFKLNDLEVINMAESYLIIIALGIIFNFINPVFSAIFNGAGNSKIPFRLNTIGLIFNVIFDPILIFGIGPIKPMGVEGAAIATVIAQLIVTLGFILVIRKSKDKYLRFNLFQKPNISCIKDIVKIGMPVAIQSGLFTIFAMLIARIIAVWGAVPIAVQKVGAQIEAISWMTAGGFSTALSAFVGQNYGAKKYDRVKKGYYYTLIISGVVGIFATLLLVFGGKFIFALFIPEEEAIKYGIVYLRILGYSQIFMCLEITTAGAFNGLGKTLIPSVIGIILTGLRVPASAVLSKENILGLNGIWWSISVSSVLKGIMLTSIFIFMLRYSKLLPTEKGDKG